jgi:3-hydroxy-9,10-secoandrosta-1,3,5(10)-triene-9,17-dione monooxygenase
MSDILTPERPAIAIPSHDDLVARARALIPALLERGPRQDEARRILDETMADLHAAGLFRILQPRCWGGYEMDPETFFAVQMALAEGDVSVAWVYGILSVHSFHLALFDRQAATDVWGADDRALVASPYAPGSAVPVDGGYVLNGHWRFSSGCEHCEWIFLGGVIDRGSPITNFHEADYRAFLLPRADFRIVDTWRTTGLKGTGSHDIVVENAFIPEHRTHRMSDAAAGTNPGLGCDNLLYRYPYWQLFLRAVSTAAIGGLQGMVDAFVRYGSARTASSGQRTAGDPDATLALAEAVAAIAEMKGTLEHNFVRMGVAASGGEPLSEQERRLFKFQAATVPRRCIALATDLFAAAGGSGVFADQPFGRFHNDLLAMGNHFANQYRPVGRKWGEAMMGLPNHDPVL